MCIGIVSEYGVPLPDEATMKRCWDANNDGAGYAYLGEGEVWQVKKGFMKWKKFLSSLQAEKFTDENTVVMHFRIGTSGRCPDKTGEFGKAEKCTHPFPISDDKSKLEATEYVSKQIVIHNGVVGHGEGFLSDTMVAIRDHLSVLWKYSNEDQKVKDLLLELLDCGPRYKGSRWFVADGEFYSLLGDWEQDADTKLWYTHDGYKEVVYSHYRGARGAWGDGGAYGWNWYDNEASAIYSPVESAGKTILCSYLKDKKAFHYCSGGSWSWEKWMDRLSPDINKPADAEENDLDKDIIKEVYDSAGNNVIALVDGHGNVVWDEILGSPDNPSRADAEDKDRFDCVSCNATGLSLESLDKGECPFCGTLLLPGDHRDAVWNCPNCDEKNFLGVSSFDIGDTECFRCGAVFSDTVPGMDGVVTWNEDTRAAHEILLAESMDGAS